MTILLGNNLHTLRVNTTLPYLNFTIFRVQEMCVHIRYGGYIITAKFYIVFETK